jgi:hypothetical protein
MPSFRALRRFHYRGQTFATGDMVTMSAIDAAVHARKGDVSLSPPAPRNPHTYNRRDMVPEPLERPTDQDQRESEAAAPATIARRRRRTRRTDMGAEDDA